MKHSPFFSTSWNLSHSTDREMAVVKNTMTKFARGRERDKSFKNLYSKGFATALFQRDHSVSTSTAKLET